MTSAGYKVAILLGLMAFGYGCFGAAWNLFFPLSNGTRHFAGGCLLCGIVAIREAIRAGRKK